MTKDYSGQNLRGRSFKGQNLEGANFSGADIRGANFSNANLIGANFSNAKAGLQPHWVVGLVVLALLLAALAGYAAALSSVWVQYFPKVIQGNTLSPGVIVFIVFNLVVVFAFVTIHQGWEATLGAGAVVGAVTVAAAGLGAVAVVRVGFGTLAGTVVGALAAAVGGAIGWADGWSSMSALGWTGAIVWALVGFGDALYWGANWVLTLAWTVSEVVVIASLSTYFGWRMLVKNQTFALVEQAVVVVIGTGGTSFRGANLTDANFQKAMLKSTDFRRANLTRTYWLQAQKLDRTLMRTTYLENPQIRQLIITKIGQDRNFDGLNLRGMNLCGANLIDASFIGADLSQANLQDADLSRAILKQTQLDGTDFTGATLTGAFIEDWNITSQTKFDGVSCEYVYMRLPTKLNPDPCRKPDNREEVFADGDFGDFIKPIIDTLDLYHNQGVDPRAIAIAFKQLAENNPNAELEIVAMEKRGQDKFLLRAKTAATADKSELSAEYFQIYNELKALAEQELKALISEKDSRIRNLENMVVTALQSPSFYSNTQIQKVSTMTNNPGGFSVGGSVGGNVNNVQGDNNRAVQGDNNQAVLGDGNQVTQQNQVSGDASLTKDDIVKLLKELEALVKTAELPAETKEEVIEDLDSAKKATDKEEPNKNLALKRLGSVAETLEKTSKSVDAGQKLWNTTKPIIVKVASWLGAAAGSHLLGL